MAQLTELGVTLTTSRCALVSGRLLADPARRLLGETMTDMLLRLDPLICEVAVEMPARITGGLLMLTRLPIEVVNSSFTPDFVVGVGVAAGTDLVVDGVGLGSAISVAAADDDGNPIGPLAAASFGTAEVFKWAFGHVYPESRAPCSSLHGRAVFAIFVLR